MSAHILVVNDDPDLELAIVRRFRRVRGLSLRRPGTAA